VASKALRATYGTSPHDMKALPVNYDEEPIEVKSDNFEGRLAVRIRNFTGHGGGKEPLAEPQSGYFQKHPELTCSIAIQGIFLKEVSANDLVFGNTFDKPIRNNLPYGSSVALKGIYYVDPSLEQDISADQPWAWSPFISTMNMLHIRPRSNESEPISSWTSSQPEEDVTSLYDSTEEVNDLKGNPGIRRKWFAVPNRRKELKIGPKVEVFGDFCNGLINFSTLSVKIPIVNMEIPLQKYWDGQPVRFVCRTRDGSIEFFRIEFVIVESEEPVDREVESSTGDFEDQGVD